MRSDNQNIPDTGLHAAQTDRLRNASVNPPAGAWPKIQQSVRRKSQLIFLYRAAAIVAISGAVIFMLHQSGTHPVEIQPQAANHPVEKTDTFSAPPIREETVEAASTVPVAGRQKRLHTVNTTDEPAQSSPDQHVLAEKEVLSETVSEPLVAPDIVQPSETSLEAPVEDYSRPTDASPITIIYELPAPEYEAPRRQVTVSRIFGLAADLKSGQTNLGLFRSIRQVFSESARRNNQQNTNLQ